MLEYIRHAVAGVAAQVWLNTSAQSWRALPRPDGPASVVVGGPRTLRILLIGSGIAVGYGVMTHDLGLAGHLARGVSQLAERGVRIDVAASPHLNHRRAIAIVRGVDLSRYDAIVLTMGGLEAFTFLPVRAWRRRLRSVLDEIEALAPPTLTVFPIGIPSAPTIASSPRALRTAMHRHVAQLDRATSELCDRRSRAVFVNFDPQPLGPLAVLLSRATYADWSSLIAPAIASANRAAAASEVRRNNEGSVSSSSISTGEPSGPRMRSTRA